MGKTMLQLITQKLKIIGTIKNKYVQYCKMTEREQTCGSWPTEDVGEGMHFQEKVQQNSAGKRL